jgi:plastocyanin
MSARGSERRRVRASAAAAVASLVVLASAQAADAEPRQLTYRYGPIELGSFEVKQDDASYSIPKPDVDGFVVGMEADVVDEQDRPVPRQRTMLHHAVFLNLGRRIGDRRDASCDRYTLLDSQSQLPGVVERFYGLGEERAVMRLPRGYGYPVKGDDQWLLTWMLMNHRRTPDRVYIRYRVTYDDAPDLKPVKPVWLDVVNCSQDPIYDVRGGGRRGSTHVKTSDWTVPWTGRLVAGMGHVHGGGKDLALSQPECSDRTLYRSQPLWGRRNHEVYKLRPVLHEPGPLNMSGFTSEQGYHLTAGQRLRLRSNYDAELPHTRVMGIAIVYIAPDETGVTQPCAPLPSDVQSHRSNEPGRATPPRVRVPLTGIGPDGETRDIRRPPGRTVRRRSGSTISVRDYAFGPVNVAVRKGATLKWRFGSETLHNVTLANGPRGFSSPNLSEDRVYRYRFSKAGTYRVFCALHPIDMTATVTVGKR